MSPTVRAFLHQAEVGQRSGLGLPMSGLRFALEEGEHKQNQGRLWSQGVSLRPSSIRCAHQAAQKRLGPAGDDPSRIPSGLKPLRSDRKLRLVALGPAAARLLRAHPRPLRGGALCAKRTLPARPAPCGGSLQPVFLWRGRDGLRTDFGRQARRPSGHGAHQAAAFVARVGDRCCASHPDCSAAHCHRTRQFRDSRLQFHLPGSGRLLVLRVRLLCHGRGRRRPRRVRSESFGKTALGLAGAREMQIVGRIRSTSSTGRSRRWAGRGLVGRWPDRRSASRSGVSS
jgi:hypothetical protein